MLEPVRSRRPLLLLLSSFTSLWLSLRQSQQAKLNSVKKQTSGIFAFRGNFANTWTAVKWQPVINEASQSHYASDDKLPVWPARESLFLERFAFHLLAQTADEVSLLRGEQVRQGAPRVVSADSKCAHLYMTCLVFVSIVV